MQLIATAASVAAAMLLVSTVAPSASQTLLTNQMSSASAHTGGQVGVAGDDGRASQTGQVGVTGDDGHASESGSGDTGQAYVADARAARDSNDCLSWTTACATIQRALNVIGTGTVHVGEGDFFGPITLSTGQHLVGSGTESTFIRPPGDSGTALTIADSASASVEKLRLGSSSPTFEGVLLKNLGTRTHVEDVDLANWEADPKRGYGGTGLLTSNGEGQQYETIGFTRTRLAMDVCGANHVFTNIRGSENFYILRECRGQDHANGGHSHVYGMKFTNAGFTGDEDPARVTTVVLDDDGGWILNNVDLDESDNSLVVIDSDHNEFNDSVIAPGTLWQVRGPTSADDYEFGHHNVFNDLTVLGQLQDDGASNEYWRPFAPYADQVTINGDRILVESRDVGSEGSFEGDGVYHYAEEAGPGDSG